jgi:hypothetical protein
MKNINTEEFYGVSMGVLENVSKFKKAGGGGHSFISVFVNQDVNFICQ